MAGGRYRRTEGVLGRPAGGTAGAEEPVVGKAGVA